MAIDLTDRIIQNSSAAPQPSPKRLKWHPLRRFLQMLCGVLLVALPLTNGLRIDVRRGECYFAWHKMAAHDLMLLFWIGMVGLWALLAVSFLYGRLWCGWVCPQTLASDFADSAKKRLDKTFRARPGQPAYWVSRSIWSVAMLAMALGTGVILACYWLAPATVAYATWQPWSDLSAGMTIYGIAAVVAADLLWVRRKFCSHACPYGMMLSLLGDKNTLAVRYLDERDDDCIRCGKCVVDCPMGIDIKKGVGQLACIGCGECVDSCNTILGRIGKPGLIEYRYGVEPERQTRKLPFLQRWGFWDKKRAAVVGVLVICAAIVPLTMFGRLPASASIVPSGVSTRGVQLVRNSYVLSLSNKTPDVQHYQLELQGLSQGQIVEPAGPITIEGHDEQQIPVTITGPSSLPSGKGVPIQLVFRDQGEQIKVTTIFYAP